MRKNKRLIAVVAVIGVIINTLFGLYNISVTKRVKPLTKTQTIFILLLNMLSTGVGFIHLSVNEKIGAYNRSE